MKNIKEKIKSFEEELLKYEVRTSKEKLEQFLADDFYELAQDGKRYNKKEMIDCLINGKIKFDFKIEEFSLKEIAEKTYLISYILYRKFLETGEKRKTLCSSIWKERERKLEMIFFQGIKGN